jgi:hypothetical protein
MHLTTFNGDFPNGVDPAPHVRRLAVGAALAALKKGVEAGLGTVPAAESPLRLTGAALEKDLNLRCLDYPYTERARTDLRGQGPQRRQGFFNRALFNLYFNPDKGSGHRIEGNDFVAIVESVADLRAPANRTREPLPSGRPRATSCSRS